jgi:hypothetical protein
MSGLPELPDDAFHTHLYLFLDGTECGKCGCRPNLLWAWEGVAPGERGAMQYAIRAVEYLKREGWQMSDALHPFCPKCAAERLLKSAN